MHQLIGVASKYKEAALEIKLPLGDIPYMSKVIKSIGGSMLRLLIDMPDNCVGIIDNKDMKLKCKNYGTKRRLKGAVQVKR